MHLDLLHLGLRACHASKQENQTKHCDKSTAKNIASHFSSPRSKSTDETSGCGFRSDENAHDYKSVPAIRHTSAKWPLDQECEIENVGGF